MLPHLEMSFDWDRSPPSLVSMAPECDLPLSNPLRLWPWLPPLSVRDDASWLCMGS